MSEAIVLALCIVGLVALVTGLGYAVWRCHLAFEAEHAALPLEELERRREDYILALTTDPMVGLRSWPDTELARIQFIQGLIIEKRLGLFQEPSHWEPPAPRRRGTRHRRERTDWI